MEKKIRKNWSKFPLSKTGADPNHISNPFLAIAHWLVEIGHFRCPRSPLILSKIYFQPFPIDWCKKNFSYFSWGTREFSQIMKPHKRGMKTNILDLFMSEKYDFWLPLNETEKRQMLSICWMRNNGQNLCVIQYSGTNKLHKIFERYPCFSNKAFFARFFIWYLDCYMIDSGYIGSIT